MPTFDVHKWRYSIEKKQYVKECAIHTNVSAAFAYSEQRRLEALNPAAE